MTFPVTGVTDHHCIRVRRGVRLLVLLLVLVLALAFALALALALLPLAFALALVGSADVHRQCVAGHEDASDLLSHKEDTLKGEQHA